ncbi:MAG: dihydroorotase [bacterium]
MNKPLLIQNARVASASSEPEEADVLTEDGTIRYVGRSLDAPDDAVTLDAEGKLLVPALFDMHVHLREPGREDTETIKTGAEAAINGGVTGLLAMPNTDPAVDTGSMVEFIQDIARDDARIPVIPAGSITKGRKGEELAEIGDMKAKGAPLITDDGDPVANARVMRRAMEYAKNFDLIVADHCEIPELSDDGSVTEGEASYRLGLAGQPSISEEICIDRDLRLSRLTGVHYHVQHLSTKEGLRSIRRFKQEGESVSCEVTPHHLLFSYEDLDGHDTSLKMNPPLRGEEDREALIDGLKDGTIDAIATDHAPHAGFEKRKDFNSAPFGITGLETALISLYDRLISPGKLGWDTIVRAFSEAPRDLLDRPSVLIEEGNSAGFMLFDPEGVTDVNLDFLRSKSSNTPFIDESLNGRIELVVHGEDVLLDRDDQLSEVENTGRRQVPKNQQRTVQ